VKEVREGEGSEDWDNDLGTEAQVLPHTKDARRGKEAVGGEEKTAERVIFQ